MAACQDNETVVQSPNAADATTIGLISASVALQYLDGLESVEADSIGALLIDVAGAIAGYLPF